MKAIRLPAMSALVWAGLSALALGGAFAAEDPKPAEEPKAAEQPKATEEAQKATEEQKAPPEAPATPEQKALQDSVAAIWKDQEIDFFYHSQTAIYSCGALQSRVESILRAVGADDVKVSAANDCDDFIFAPQATGDILRPQLESDRFGNRARARQQTSHVRITFKSPVLATPDALAELNKDKGRRELIARVTGNNAALQEATGIFPAHWQEVSLSRGGALRLEPEECELVEQMSRSVLPKLGVRIVGDNLMCMPHQVSLLQPRLTVAALVKTQLNVGSPPAKSKKNKKSKRDKTPPPAESGSAESPAESAPAPESAPPSTPPQ